MRPRGRGERVPGQRGGAGLPVRRIRGSNDEHLVPTDPEEDPFCNLKDDDDDLPDPANEEYIWPQPEEEEDD